MVSILFVDDDPEILKLLQDSRPLLSPDWQTVFAKSGREALEILDRGRFDVVVSDMVMPEIDGSELLAEVRRRHPSVIRIVLSGYVERAEGLRSVDSAHQYLTKPFSPTALKQTLARATALRDLMADERLKQVVSRLGSLPSLPSLYLKLQDACRDPSVSLRTVADIMAQDAAMTAKILQMVNSAFFGMRRRVSSPMHAVQLLGLDTVNALTLSAHVFFGCDPLRLALCSMGSLWSHSLAVSAFAAEVAMAEGGDGQLVEDARVAGLLHDAGALVFADSLPGAYSEVVGRACADGRPLCEVETEGLGVSHAAVGAYLLGLWGIPENIVEGIAFHHAPRQVLDQRASVLTAVHAADAFAHEVHPQHVVGAPSELDRAYLGELGLTDRVPAWREACWVTVERAAVAGQVGGTPWSIGSRTSNASSRPPAPERPTA
jgi:HD-like signal output (HDOD) protein